jgi:hypothetical protein
MEQEILGYQDNDGEWLSRGWVAAIVLYVNPFRFEK